MRELIVGGGFSSLVLIPLLIFILAGWPGGADPCVGDTSTGARDTCWCEAFLVSEIGEPGVRQSFNTWSNLMALVYGGIVGFFVWWTRRNGVSSGTNRMRSHAVYGLVYICVVIYLGLGSMWFHASITAWGGVMDQISMYTFANFILCYTIVRLFPATWPDWPIGVVYLVLTVLLATLGATLSLDALPISALLIAIVVTIYAGLEIYIAGWRPDLRSDWVGVVAFYVPALLVFGLAMLVWSMSQSGRPWCSPYAGFQLHGLWHWLAGITSVLLYFYWRRARG